MYSAKLLKSIKVSGGIGGWVAGRWDRLTVKVSLKMTFESRKWLEIYEYGETQCSRPVDCGEEKRKAWEPTDRLCWVIKNWWDMLYSGCAVEWSWWVTCVCVGRFMPCLKFIVQNAINKELRLLRGKTIECISLIGLAVSREKVSYRPC